MWLQRGEVPKHFHGIQVIAGVLLNVATSAEFRYRDNDLDLSQFIGFTQQETLMIKLEDELPKRVEGTVIGLITPRSACMYMAEIAKGRLTKEVMRAQAHHYIVIPKIDERKLDQARPLTVQFYKKLWGVRFHQQDSYQFTRMGELLSMVIQQLFHMQHPTDLSVEFDADHVLDEIMYGRRKVE